MTFEEFKQSLVGSQPPVCLSVELQSLWFAAMNKWKEAHELVQYEPGKNCALVHAYLHRLEGDIANADYWYSKAGSDRPLVPENEEFEHLVNAFI